MLFFFPFLFPSYCHSFGPCVVSIVFDSCNQSPIVFFYVVLESFYRSVNTVFNASKSSSSLLSSLLTSSLRCCALCMIIRFLVLWSICLSSSLSHSFGHISLLFYNRRADTITIYTKMAVEVVEFYCLLLY